jgi:hypothetical protein
MNLKERINLLVQLGEYMIAGADEWQAVKLNAFAKNNWFTIHFIDLAVKNISAQFLREDQLVSLAEKYHIPETNNNPSNGRNQLDGRS